MAITSSSTITQSLPIHNVMWLNLMNRLLGSNYLFDVYVESSKSLIPIPWSINDKLCIPYGKEDIPFLKKLLFVSDCLLICKSLQSLIERAYDCYKAMDILRFDVLTPLNRLTRLAEPFVRQRCCVLIRVLAGQPLGKVSVVRNAVLMTRLMALIADDDYRVRFHCALAVLALAEHRPGNEAMVESGCADRVLLRMYDEQDSRVVPVLLKIVGRLMATNHAVRERMNGAVSFGPFLESAAAGCQQSAVSDALVDCGQSTAGRGLLDYLKETARSSDYRTTLNSVVCMSRLATVREANEYLARDRRTVDLLVSFVLSSELRRRALRTFSAQLLCTLADTSVGCVHLRAATVDSRAELNVFDGEDLWTKRYLRKLADIVSRPND